MNLPSELLEPLNNQKRKIVFGINYSQETVKLGNERFTNLHWVELDKNKFKFDLSSKTLPIPLKDFDTAKGKLVAGINFGSFFLSDDIISPAVPFYNLLIDNGRVCQLPSNCRPALVTENGKLRELYVPAKGTLNIGGKTFTWTGSHGTTNSELAVFGMFDIDIIKTSVNGLTPRREMINETRFVTCTSSELLLAINLNDGRPEIVRISNQPVDLTQVAFVLRGSVNLLKMCQIGERVTNLEIEQCRLDQDCDACSASFSLGKTRDELVENLKQQLIYPKDSEPKPLSAGYLKSWSVVLETKDSVIFFINDARPKVRNQDGITVFELQDILRKKFEYLWACVGDSGQSSKLMVINGDTRDIYGNMHYKNYDGQIPVWNGLNGRPIPIALLAYE